jgi:signal transduction histidine kinase
MEENRELSNESSATEVEEMRRLLADYESRFTEFARLASHVRHEVNNPLTGLLGQAQLLLRDDLSERSRRRVETIVELSARIRDAVLELRVSVPPESLL